MNIPAILQNIRPGASWALTGDTYGGLDWLDGEQSKPLESEIEAAWPRVEALERNAFAALQRNAAYIHEADPLFMYWQAGEGTKESWLAKREEIRGRFPYVEVPA
jgi:hypothetical protein